MSAGADIYTPPAFVDGIAALSLLLVGDPEKVDRKAQLDRVGAALESLAHEVSTQREEAAALRAEVKATAAVLDALGPPDLVREAAWFVAAGMLIAAGDPTTPDLLRRMPEPIANAIRQAHAAKAVKP